MTAFADPRFWDNIAQDYAAQPFPNPDATARKLAIVKEGLSPTDRLLDVGCGTGTIPIELAPHVAEAHGVDISPRMIDIARAKASEASLAHVRFTSEPAGDLARFGDASFDCVCAFNILHLVENPATLVGGMARVLRPGGTFVTSTPCLGGSWFPPFALILPVMRWVGKAPAVRLIRQEELIAMLEAAGLEEVVRHDVGGEARDVFLTARRAVG